MIGANSPVVTNWPSAAVIIVAIVAAAYVLRDTFR